MLVENWKGGLQYVTASRLKKVAKLFKLSLPGLLEYYQLEGLLAIVPDENFQSYLEQKQCSLVYVTAPTENIISEGSVVLDLEYFVSSKISTETQLCAALEEVEALQSGHQSKNSRFCGFAERIVSRSICYEDQKYAQSTSSIMQGAIQNTKSLCPNGPFVGYRVRISGPGT